jgi:hypothetical protein
MAQNRNVRPVDMDHVESVYGPVVLSTNDFELRALVDGRGLHAYAFRKSGDRTLPPVQFIRGVNILLLKRR